MYSILSYHENVSVCILMNVYSATDETKRMYVKDDSLFIAEKLVYSYFILPVFLED